MHKEPWRCGDENRDGTAADNATKMDLEGLLVKDCNSMPSKTTRSGFTRSVYPPLKRSSELENRNFYSEVVGGEGHVRSEERDVKMKFAGVKDFDALISLVL